MKGIEFTYAKAASGQIVQKPFHAGVYKLQPNHVLTFSGKIHYYAEPLKVKDEMEELIKWYTREKALHAVEKAAIFHYRFVAIHPFDDGNGRMARLLMNLILMKNGYPPCIIQNVHRRKYLETLEIVDTKKDYAPFITWIGEELLSTQQQMLDILSGKNSLNDAEISHKKISASLNEFQRESLILEILKNNDMLSIGQILEHLPSIKRPTLKSDLKRLVTARKIKKKGVGKGVVYFAGF
jgi:Fic family protein